MNVFVLGTGRCGTVTFSKACQHITNFTCGHETMAGITTPDRFEYPEQHIEVDPHLSWTLGQIIERYPHSYFVHLQRDKSQVVDSWIRRGIRNNVGAAPLIDVIFQTKSRRIGEKAYRRSVSLLHDTVVANIQRGLKNLYSDHVWLHEAKRWFPLFWHFIRAEGDLEAALSEFDIKHNAG